MTHPVPATAPTLSDGVVTLRAHTGDDLDDLTAMGTDPDTVDATTVPFPFEARHAREWITDLAPGSWRDGTACRWAIETHGRFAGNLDLRLGPPPDVGYALAPWARGRGVAARAVRLMTTWAFTTSGIPIVHWSAHAGNLASWRVAHACGFTFHGSRPLAIEQRGELRDGWFASLRPGDGPAPRTTWWTVPTLTGRHVRLRAHTAADHPRMVEAGRDGRTRHWLPSASPPDTDTGARDLVLAARLGESLGRSVAWVAADPADGRFLAHVSIFRLDDTLNPTGAEIGYWAHPDARGRGVVTEAVELVAAHAFTPVAAGGLGRHRIQIGAAWTNTASRRVAERAGFTLVGRHRLDGLLGDRTLDDGAWYDRLREDTRDGDTRDGDNWGGDNWTVAGAPLSCRRGSA